MERNIELDLAWKFVESTGTSLFLTGKAGTGKTTFLHKLQRESSKRMVVLAPTGIAAMNAGRHYFTFVFPVAFCTLCSGELVSGRGGCFLLFSFQQGEDKDYE